MRGVLLPVVDADVNSAYSAAWSLLGCSSVLCANRVEERGALRRLRALAATAASGDPRPLFDPATYRYFGMTLAETAPDGEPWPVELHGPDCRPRFVVTPLRSRVPLPYTWPDVVLAALLSRRVPVLVSVTRLVPVGTERVRPLPLRAGLVVAPGADPVVSAARLRSAAKDAGDQRLDDQLQVFGNALAWGVPARLDQHRASGRRGYPSVLVEEATEWSWPPIASTVPALARMWLATVERLVTDLGGVIVTRDTDGVAILASPEGGTTTLPDGRVVRVLSWAEVDALLAPFDALDPFGDARPFWKVER